MASKKKPPLAPTERFLPRRRSLASLRRAAAGCRGCPLYLEATQTVFGEGAAGASVVLLGATAAQALLGADFRVTRSRGKVIPHALGKVIATLHPSAILRAPDPRAREESFLTLVADLRLAARQAR